MDTLSITDKNAHKDAVQLLRSNASGELAKASDCVPHSVNGSFGMAGALRLGVVVGKPFGRGSVEHSTLLLAGTLGRPGVCICVKNMVLQSQ